MHYGYYGYDKAQKSDKTFVSRRIIITSIFVSLRRGQTVVITINNRLLGTYGCRFLCPRQGVAAHLRREAGWAKRRQRARCSVRLLMELWLVGLEHANFSPAVEK